MTTEDEVIQRLTSLIQRGQAVARQTFTSHVVFDPQRVDFGPYAGWRAQAEAALIGVLGHDSSYVEAFNDATKTNHEHAAKAGISIIASVLDDFRNGHLRKLEVLLAGDVFSDFLEMAAHLLETGYKDPAAMLTGAVLEDGLKRIAAAKSVAVRSQDDLASLNTKCVDAKIYGRLQQQQVQVWIRLRNHAAHGEFAEYSAENVKTMHEGVSGFLTTYMV